jgi:cell wall-associated NlpC family hydrolase
MLDRRRARPALAAVAAALVLSPCLPAHADPGNPTPSEIAAARRAVTAAKASVQTLMNRAEQAAEAYNGALTRANAAERASTQAASRAAVADAAEGRAEGVAAGAQAVADTAKARAERRKAEQDAAEALVQKEQRSLDQVAASAYQGGGRMNQLGSLMTTADPSQLAQSAAYIDRIGAFQHSVVIDMARARDKATTAAQLAAAAQAEAQVANDAAQAALDKAQHAQAVAAAARDTAGRAAADAHHALYLASKARGHAQYLVSRAESTLGNAKQRARHLEEAAAAARAAARHITFGKAPSDAAATAIHWAYEEIGVPYSWGGGDENGPTYGFAQGAGTRGFDCSGLTLFAYAHAGIHLDHYTGSQWNQGQRVSSRGDLQPGDLMFFAYDTSDASTIHHVALYIGNGQMIEAPYTGEVVRVTSYDRGDFIGGVRPWV